MDISYRILRSSRRSLCLEIVNGELIIRSPYFVSSKTIERFIDKKSNWIKKVISDKEKKFERKYCQGEVYLVLGQEYSLEIIESKQRRFELKGKLFVLKTPLQDKATIKYLLHSHYKKLTSNLVRHYLLKHASKFSYENSNFKVKLYSSKWGSCSPNNSLSFSVKLAMTPPAVIEYVVVHELAHLKYKHHQKEFWQEVEKIAPNYREARRWIRNYHHKLVL